MLFLRANVNSFVVAVVVVLFDYDFIFAVASLLQMCLTWVA